MIKIRFEFKIYIYHNCEVPEKTQKHTSPQTVQETPPLPASPPPVTTVQPISFKDFASHEIARTRKNQCFSTADNYKTAIRSLLTFLGKDDVDLAAIDTDLIIGYEKWLRKRGVCLNTISCYMRSLRSLFNKAVDKGLVQQGNPFSKVFTGNTKTDKRSISKRDLLRLHRIQLFPHTSTNLARDTYLFSFYALGMPFVDLAYLRWTQIRNGYITYYRQKTGQKIIVKIEPCMHAILKRYKNAQSPYVFPYITSTEPERARKQYENALRRYNHSLKRLAKKAKIKDNLTSYAARHTWASIAYQHKVDLPVISKALGHTDTETTLVYIRELNDNRCQIANRQLLHRIGAV